MKKKYLLLFFILVLAFILRFYKLGEVPLGFHQDEVSQAYNSYSILTSGKDRYGKLLPVLFRSFGSYQPPVYTYLTVVPIHLFGNTVYAARSTSALFGVLTVVITYFIVKLLSEKKYGEKLALISSLIMAISPWAIHFSRRVVEGNLGLFFFLLAFYLFLLSLKKVNFFISACIVLGISTFAYYSEQLISVIFLPFFLWYFKSYFIKYRKVVVYGLLLFGLTLSPHLITILGGAFFARFNQVGTSADNPFVLEFIKHFFGYFSPLYLFADAGSGLARVSPSLGVFYDWFFIPFLVGIYFLRKIIRKEYFKFLLIFIPIALIPASLTGDVFYPLRALVFFWILSFIISIGIVEVGEIIKNAWVKVLLFLSLILYSIGSFYVSYFILFQHEASEFVAKSYSDLSNELDKYGEYKIVLDSTRDSAVGLRIAYLKKIDPKILQGVLGKQLTKPYYTSKVNFQETYMIGNIEARPIDWKVDRCSPNAILIGDKLAFSETQIKEHNLIKIFEIAGVHRDLVFFGYGTNPDERCKME